MFPLSIIRHLPRRSLGVALGMLAAGPMASAAVVNLSASHDFAAPANITADASTQLTGLSSRSSFQGLPSANRFVYSFETWPETTTSLGNNYTLQFDLTGDGAPDQRVTISQAGQPSTMSKTTNAAASSPSTLLGGLGNMGWGSMWTAHTFTFETPVAAVGFVYRSPSPFYLKKNAYNASDNYPVSYTLTDGTIVNLGAVGTSGATIAANTNTWVGLNDPTGKGIVSFTVRCVGSASGADQYNFIDDLAFASIVEPAVAPVANLTNSHDFRVPSNITASASSQLAGLASLSEFRSAPVQNRFVYSFSTWPQAGASLGASSYAFQFDLNGDGTADQSVTVAASGSYVANLTQMNAGTATSSPTKNLGGLGDIGWGGSTFSAQKFTFQKPVSAVGLVYRSSGNLLLRKAMYNANDYPVSYKLTDGTIVNLGAQGVAGATLAANDNTFVGVVDHSGKGIVELTTRVQGTAGSASQYAFIDDLSFVLAGPPAGNWTLAFEDNFDGAALNTAVWSKGMRWAGVINNELQAYVPENVSVANGLCTIKVEKRTAVNKDMYGYASGNANYASGCIQTYNKWRQTYGYFEARIRMASGPGTWPAFWLMPDRIDKPNDVYYRTAVGSTVYYSNGTTAPCTMGNEIDVTEFFSSWVDSNNLYTSHSGYFWGYGSGQSWGTYAIANNGYGSQQYRYPNATTQFHTYGVYWGPGVLNFYVDGQRVATRTDAANISSAPEYLILNCALHTNVWTKTITTSEIDSGLPCTMDIDYVKVWSGTPF